MITPQQKLAQAAHLMRVPEHCRIEMRQAMMSQKPVRVYRQNDVSDVPPWAICIADEAFWIECCETREEAVAYAESLGMPVVD